MPWLADRVPLQRGKIALNPDIPIGGDGRARILAISCKSTAGLFS
jgi:hypothetical protein